MPRHHLVTAAAAAVTMALSCGAVAAQEVKVESEKVAKSATVTEAPAEARLDPDAKVCKKITYTGSRLGTAKICKKRSEWAERAFTDQKQTERIQHNTMPHISR